jgi:hypothetical protein
MLKISLLLHCLSVALVIFLLLHRPKPALPAPSLPATGAPPETASNPQAPSAAQPEPFHWRRLESTDYRTYIANLRGIECPEQTIRDIITADVDAAIFAPRRHQLKQDQKSGLDATLQELNNDESALIASLLGTQPAAGDVATDAPPRSRSLRSRMKETPIAMPVAFQDPNLAGLKLNESQLQAIAEMRKSFLDQVGGPNQDTNDPAYRERWQKAQPIINDELEAVLGRAAYQELQFEAQSAALSQPGQTGKP